VAQYSIINLRMGERTTCPQAQTTGFSYNIVPSNALPRKGGSLIRVQVWTHEQAPTEDAIRQIMDAEGLQPRIWSNSPGDVHELPNSGESATLNAGDRLDLPPGVMHSAVVGPKGVVCLEAHRR
jgi:hypothetical protein